MNIASMGTGTGLLRLQALNEDCSPPGVELTCLQSFRVFFGFVLFWGFFVFRFFSAAAPFCAFSHLMRPCKRENATGWYVTM